MVRRCLTRVSCGLSGKHVDGRNEQASLFMHLSAITSDMPRWFFFFFFCLIILVFSLSVEVFFLFNHTRI